MTTPKWTATNSEGYEAPAALAVDAVVITVRDGKAVVLLRFGLDDKWALPGGLVAPTESADKTIRRKLEEKTGLREVYLEQLVTATEPDRDARGWIPCVAHLALVPPETEPTDPEARWWDWDGLPQLAFDHADTLAVARERIQGKLWWSNVAAGVLPGRFTLSEARGVYDALDGRAHNPRTFGRDLRSTGLIEELDEKRVGGAGRPAQLFRFVAVEQQWARGRRKRGGST